MGRLFSPNPPEEFPTESKPSKDDMFDVAFKAIQKKIYTLLDVLPFILNFI